MVPEAPSRVVATTRIKLVVVETLWRKVSNQKAKSGGNGFHPLQSTAKDLVESIKQIVVFLGA